MVRLIAFALIAAIRFWSLIIISMVDRRPTCITCGKRYAANNGMFGECADCVFTMSGEQINSFIDATPLDQDVDVPLFDDDGMEPFVFGADDDGNVVVRQRNEWGEETWQYIGYDD